MVQDADYSWHIKPMAKTDESNRTVVLPDFVVKEVALPIGLHPEQVSNRFRRAVRSSGLPHFRFHDLRHYYVSIAHALGVPDAYIMQMGGWKTDNVMHRVYRDTLPDVMQVEQDKLTKHFHDAFHDA
jgi:integrase